jgi:hypothetical protein
MAGPRFAHRQDRSASDMQLNGLSQVHRFLQLGFMVAGRQQLALGRVDNQSMSEVGLRYLRRFEPAQRRFLARTTVYLAAIMVWLRLGLVIDQSNVALGYSVSCGSCSNKDTGVVGITVEIACL